jgi:hypothetical protein
MSFLFGPSYPEQTASDVDGKEYDYVIVGGTSGINCSHALESCLADPAQAERPDASSLHA